MKTLAYLSSYKTLKNDFYEEIEKQKANIEDYAFQYDICIDRFFTESFESNDTSKPVLINIIHDYYDSVKTIIAQNPNSISRNSDFRYWILDELKRIGIDIIFLENTGEPVANKNILQKTTEIKSKIKEIPSLPHVVTKVMEVVQDDNSSAFTLSKIIAGDLGLTSKVLKIVNSAVYGFEKQITSIRQAIVVLGFTTIRGIVLSAGIFKIFSPQKNTIFDYEDFWRHCMLTAMASKHLLRLIDSSTHHDIFSIAFLHDLGKIILAQYDYDNYLNVYSQIQEQDDYRVKFRIEEEACGINHCEIAYSVLNSWNLPSVFPEVCLYHHTPQLSKDYEFACTLVYIADTIVNYVVKGKLLDTKPFEEDTLSRFNITQENLEDLYNYTTEQVEKVKDITGFFN